jgi:phosphoadenosine phosphosulfate reductase
MTLLRTDLFGSVDLESVAIQRLQAFEPPEGYILCNSYGKDSCVIEHLANKACVKFESHHSHTGLDAPELIYFGRENFPNTIVHPPIQTIDQLIIKKGLPPTRGTAFCCEFLKENLPVASGRRIILGVRWDESLKRSKRRAVEQCFRDSSKTYVNPIIEWSNNELWQYIKQEGIAYCEGYDRGVNRYGCIGCPKAGPAQMKKEFAMYPQYYDRFMRIFEKAWPVTHNMSKRTGKPRKLIFNSAQEMMDWWLCAKTHEGDPDQSILFE